MHSRHVFQNYQAQIRLSVKVKFLVGLARTITEAIGTTNMPQVREQLGSLAASAAWWRSMLAGMEGLWRHARRVRPAGPASALSAHTVTRTSIPADQPHPRSGRRGIIMLPSSFRDWADPELAPILHRTQRSANFSSQDKVKLLKAAWDAIGSEFASRHTQYEMFYAGARFVTTGHSYRTFDWSVVRGMVDQLMSTYDLDVVMPLPA